MFPRISPMDIINNAKNVFAVQSSSGGCRISSIPEKTVQQFISLGVDIRSGTLLTLSSEAVTHEQSPDGIDPI